MPDVQLTWLGHATFRFDTPASKRVYIDPWLENPKCPEGEKEPERVDLIAITHGHGDHVGNSIDLQKKFGCKIVAPVELSDWLSTKDIPEESLNDPNKGGTVDIDGLKVTLTDANHSSSIWDDGKIQYLGEPVGLVFEVENGTKIYVAGDTNVFGDMQLIRRLYEPDVAILPIGGHYTMDPREAAIALEFLGVKRCVPCLYGTFPILAGTPDQLRELAPAGVEIVALEPGETVEV
jgi:L-ascorbate metabolism protein UlaG (beta-lactamase superfamily)